MANPRASRSKKSEVARLRARLAEAEETLNAIRNGEVDAIAVDGPHGQQIFTLQSADQPYRVLAERMSEGAATLTPEGTILFCNQRLAEMAGLPAVRLVGSQFVSLLEGAEQSRFRELVETASEHDVRAEGHLRHMDGSMLPVQLSLSQIPIEYSRHGICLVATDLSDRKRVEEEVRRLNMELEGRVTCRTAELVAANQDMEAFSYGVAHDLRAPLRHVHGFAEILRRDLESVLSTDGQHSLDRIIEGILQMEKLLEDLLNFSRLGRQDVGRQPTPLKQLVQRVIDDQASETINRRIEWRVGDLPVVDCDPVLMNVVLANLLSNAVKYTRPRPRAIIEVGTTTLDDEPVVFVRDNGVGFDMKYADRLFGVFQRLHRDKDFEGTGVGLAIVQRIVRKHGGKIWAEAELNKGATFYFTVGGADSIRECPAAAKKRV